MLPILGNHHQVCPISSRTTESGWEYLSRDRVQAFPVGSEIRSPEIHTPSHRSPVNREVFDFTGSAQHTAAWLRRNRHLSTLCLVPAAKHPSALRSVQHHLPPHQIRASRRLRTREPYVIDNFVIYSRHWERRGDSLLRLAVQSRVSATTATSRLTLPLLTLLQDRLSLSCFQEISTTPFMLLN